jgi:hypothetical protein
MLRLCRHRVGQVTFKAPDVELASFPAGVPPGKSWQMSFLTFAHDRTYRRIRVEQRRFGLCGYASKESALEVMKLIERGI